LIKSVKKVYFKKHDHEFSLSNFEKLEVDSILNDDLLIAIIETSNPRLCNSLAKTFIAFSAPPPETELVTIEMRTTWRILLDIVNAKNMLFGGVDAIRGNHFQAYVKLCYFIKRILQSILRVLIYFFRNII
jgi:hypothetical protein